MIGRSAGTISMRVALAALLAVLAGAGVNAQKRPTLNVDDASPAERRRLVEVRVTAEFVDRPAAEIAKYLAGKSQLNVAIDPLAYVGHEVDGRKRPMQAARIPVTMNLRDATLEDALVGLADEIHVRIVVGRDRVFLTTKDPIPLARDPLLPFDAWAPLARVRVSADFIATPVGEALRTLEQEGGQRLTLDLSWPQHATWKVGFGARDMSLINWLEWIAYRMRLRWTVRDGVAVLTDTLARDEKEINRRLDEGRVSCSFAGARGIDVVEWLKRASGIECFLVDPRVRVNGNRWDETILTVEMTDAKLRDAVDRVAKTFGCHLVVTEGFALFTNREIAPMPAPKMPPALAKKLDETIVSFTFVEQPAKEAFDFLGTLGNMRIRHDGWTIADDPRTMTLRVDHMSLRLALNWMCRFADLTWSVRDGEILVLPRKKPAATEERH